MQMCDYDCVQMCSFMTVYADVCTDDSSDVCDYDCSVMTVYSVVCDYDRLHSHVQL